MWFKTDGNPKRANCQTVLQGFETSSPLADIPPNTQNTQKLASLVSSDNQCPGSSWILQKYIQLCRKVFYGSSRMTLLHLLSRHGDGKMILRTFYVFLLATFGLSLFEGKKFGTCLQNRFWAKDHKKDPLENPHRPLAADTLEWNKHETYMCELFPFFCS